MGFDSVKGVSGVYASHRGENDTSCYNDVFFHVCVSFFSCEETTRDHEPDAASPIPP